MKFDISRLGLGRPPQIPIEQATFEEIREAVKGLHVILRIEFDYHVLIDNWMELEDAALRLALESSARLTLKRISVDRAQLSIDRHSANFLSSARAFIDHTNHLVASLPDCSPADKAHVKALFTAQYDAKMSYRAVEALRNYAQHSGLPTQAMTFGSRWTKEADGGRLVFCVSPQLILDYLAGDSNFKPKVLAELSAAGERKVAVMPLIREYMESLSHIAGELRQLLAARTKRWAGTLDHWIAAYGEAAPDEKRVVGVAAFATTDDGRQVLEEIHLSVEFKERIAFLQELNKPLINLHKRQIRSE